MTAFFSELNAVLITTPTRWAQLVEHFPLSLLKRQPKPGEWSTLEVLQHLIDMEQTVFPDRVRMLLAEEDFPAFFPDDEGSALPDDVDAKALVTEFADLRAQNLELVATITERDLQKTATHAELGEVSLLNLLNEWGGHDLMHFVQAEQALMQPFIERSGPWLVYFEAHKA